MNNYNYKELVQCVINQGFSLAESYEDWTKIGFSLSTLGEAGREMFHEISAMSAKYRRGETDKKFDEALRSNRRIDIGSFIYLCQQAGINTNQFYQKDENGSNVIAYTPKPPQQQKEKPTDFISAEYLQRCASYQSELIYFLCGLFDKHTLESPTIERLMCYYHLGATKDKSVIFWQIDSNHQVRSGKIMRYDRTSGHRVKDGNGVSWVHSLLKKENLLPTDWKLCQCLFGEHLLRLYPQRTIALVESEKTALIGSGFLPKFLWLATGGKMNFSERILQPLKGRTVIAFPDADAYHDWKEKAEELAKIGIKITVSDILERVVTDEDRANKIDIADLLIRQAKAKEKQEKEVEKASILAEFESRNPYVRTLVEEFGCTVLATP